MIYIGSSFFLVEDFKTYMITIFEMADLDLLHYFLGIEVKQGEDEIFISLKKIYCRSSQEIQNIYLQFYNHPNECE